MHPLLELQHKLSLGVELSEAIFCHSDDDLVHALGGGGETTFYERGSFIFC